MDGSAFDDFSRAMARGIPRRQVLARLGAGGLGAALLGAIGIDRVRTVRSALPVAQAATCQLDIIATVRIGTNASEDLGGAEPGELRGQLSFGLDDTGAVTEGRLLLEGGVELPVLGQVVGRAVHLRVVNGETSSIILVGTAEQDLGTCQGSVDGMMTGPAFGDLGDWHAIATALQRQSGGTSDDGSDDTSDTNSGRSPLVATARPAVTGRPASEATSEPSEEEEATTEPDGCGQLGAECASRADCCSDFECRGGICRVRHSDCISGDDACSSTPECCFDRTCTNGRCLAPGETPLECPDGETACAGECVDLQTNGANCGECGTSCGSACVDGECAEETEPGCPDGQTECGGVCLDTTADDANCGICGFACPAGRTCVGGSCLCVEGTTECLGICCAANEVCVEGFCQAAGDEGGDQQGAGDQQGLDQGAYEGGNQACSPAGEGCADGSTCCSGSCNALSGQCD
jgi:hypothetical protein